MSRLLIFILVLALANFVMPAFARDDFERAQACKQDQECTVIAKECIVGGVNKNYKHQVDRMSQNVNREMNCNPKKTNTKHTAFCEFPRVECKNRADRQNGKKCYAREGHCSVRYNYF